MSIGIIFSAPGEHSPEKHHHLLMRRTFGQNFHDAVIALDAAGLDTVELVRFMDSHLEEDYPWPDDVIREFFYHKLEELIPLGIEVNRSILLRLGVRPDALNKLWRMYEDAGELWVIEDVLSSHFISVVKSSDRRENAKFYREAAIGGNEGNLGHLEIVAKAAQIQEGNVDSLMNASGPTCEIRVQSSGDFLKGSFSTKTVPILDEIKPDESHLLYHSTDIDSAASIIANGPFSQTSNIRADFDGAFYLNKKVDEAIGWARKFASTSESKTAAIIVYNVTEEHLASLKVLLPTMEQWSMLVSAFRMRQYNLIRISDFLEYDVIIGPKCKNPRGAFSKKASSEWIPLPHPDQEDQVAFCNPREANKLQHHLVGILLYRL